MKLRKLTLTHNPKRGTWDLKVDKTKERCFTGLEPKSTQRKAAPSRKFWERKADQ